MEENENKPVFFDDKEDLTANAKIKVIGVGGGGSNAVNEMIHDKSDQVEYWVLNTDSQALANSPCDNKYVLGKEVTKGLGAGGNPAMGKKAAEGSYKDIQLLVKGADLVFLAAGEGGGTGTGAAPVVAKAAKESGSLVLAIVTRPFNFEGRGRSKNALEGINELKRYVDAIIVVSNDKLVFNNGGMSIKKAFAASDAILAQSVKTITDLILVHGLINLDFADVKTTLTGKGIALIGIGFGQGENKAIKAAQGAINSPLLESSIKGARSMIINVTCGDETSLEEVQYAISYITEASSTEVNIIFGVQLDDSFKDKIKIAIIATDFTKDIDFSKTTVPLPRVDLKTGKPEEKDGKKEVSAVEKEIEEKSASTALPDYLREMMKDTDNCRAKADSFVSATPAARPSVAADGKNDDFGPGKDIPIPDMKDDEDEDISIPIPGEKEGK
ncbi:MAG: cell division protein FtsZ [Bacilli bacterium]